VTTIAECLSRAEQKLPASDSARRDLEVLLCYVLKQTRVYLFTWSDKELSEQEFTGFTLCVERRQKGEPIAYIVGSKEFWSLDFDVNESTLIPRPDTEILVEAVLDLLPESPRKLIDLGTGTGAIALALASERPQWQILGLDKNIDACTLAEQNRQNNKISNVSFIHSDWFDRVQETGYDAVLSNPPYIDANDEHLQQGDVRFEPHSALVAEESGLGDLRHIAQESWSRLLTGGYLFLEHGYQQAPMVRALLSEMGYQAIETREDLGGQPRVTLAQKP
jgi:release factor glutamine methyltransferase